VETDDKKIREITTGIISLPSVLVAHEMGFFTYLARGPRTIRDICEKFAMPVRAAECLAVLLASLELLEAKNGAYSLSPIARDFLLPESPYSNCGFLNYLIKYRASYSFDSIKTAYKTGQPQWFGPNTAVFEQNKANPEAAEAFTMAMHALALGPASGWPKKLDMSNVRSFVDIAGGSGAHSMAVCRQWKQIKATVFDLATVTQVTRKLIEKEGLAESVKVLPGDMFKDALPAGDAHFYSNIFHDWSPEECLMLAKKSFEALSKGGRIMLHEILLNDQRSGPFVPAATNLSMLLWYQTGRQYSGKEYCEILAQAGFKRTEVTPTYGYWSIVSGIRE
jgi:hypothetical protein